MVWEKYRLEILNNKKIEDNWYILGIDLGTTHSVISYFHLANKKPEPIDISQGFGKIPMPSVIQYRNELEEEWVIGEEAYKSMILYPEETVLSIKRKMGSKETVQLGDRAYLPEELSAKIINELINHAKALNPNQELIGVVVSVPYDFDDAAKRATFKACQLAGISDQLIGLIEEPKAAALTYHFKHALSKGNKMMIFDFGGGTLDITIFEVAEMTSECIHLKVISEGGDALHGGDQIDNILLEYLYKVLFEKTGLSKESISKEHQAELRQSARDIKERLSGVKKIRVPFTFCIPPFMIEVTREQLEAMIDAFIQKTKQLVLKALSDGYEGRIHPNDIDIVLLEGGSSAAPWVKEMLIHVFNDYEKIWSADKPALDISLGATYYGAIKMGLLNHPDMIATGQMIQFELTVPHDIGLEVDYLDKKTFHPLISRGTPYLLSHKSQVFNLSGNKESEMTELTINILERMHKEDSIDKCRLIGEVTINGLPKRPLGKTKLKVTLSVEEASGIVKGEVEDLGYPGLYEPSGFKTQFSPNRLEKTILTIER